MSLPKVCLDCGEQLHGRIDKKFCDDLCRSNYNNKLYSEKSTVIKQINKILRKNRSVLMELNPTGKTKVARKKLLSKGFDFTFFTSVYQTGNGKTYYFCYEYGYFYLENEEILLVKREDGLNK